MKWCSNCGAQLEKNEKYCPECGARQKLEDYEEKGKKKAANGASKKGKITILCIVVIMIVVAVAGINYLQNQKAKAEER